MNGDQAQTLRQMVFDANMDTAAPGMTKAGGASAALNPDRPSAIKPALAKTMTITSGKGGVGKTNVAINLAVCLARCGHRVVLLDADLGTANADVLCNLSPAWNLAHVVAGRATLEAAMIEAPGGFQLVAGASGLATIAALGEQDRNRLIEWLARLEQNNDLILIDTGAGVNPNVLGFVTCADQVVVVTTPEPTAITDAYAVIKTARRRRPDLDVRVLVNMVRNASEGQAVFDRVESVCRKFLSLAPRYAGYVLNDAHVTLAVRGRTPFVIDSPHCPASRCVLRFAQQMDQHDVMQTGHGLFRRLAGWFAG